MADSDGKIVIDVSADITQLQKDLNQVDAELKKAAKRMSDFDKETKLNPDGITDYAKQAKLLEEQLALTGNKLEVLTKAQASVSAAFAKGDLPVKEYEAYNLEIEKTEQSLEVLSRQLIRTNQEISANEHFNKSAAESARVFESAFGALGDGLSEIERNVKELNPGLSETEGTMKDAAESAKVFEAAFNESYMRLSETERAIKRLNPEISEFEDSMEEAAKETKELSKETENATEKTSTFGDMLKAKITGDIILGGLKKLGKEIINIGKATIESGIQFESAFAGVEKTVDATATELEGLRSEIREMALDIPATANAIAGVAEAAGQLGIQNANIMGFTETMVGLGEATDVSAQRAATSLAQFANVTGMLQTDFDRLGSSIVDLGNNFATTESSIIAMGQRLAGAGSQVGMSEASIMGFSAALASVGIEAEMGGSAFSKMMNMIDKSAAHGADAVKKFSDIANMSGAEFVKLWEEDAAGALVKFIEGLGDVEAAGGNLNLVLEDLGIEEVRMSDALRRAAGASDLFAKAVTDSNKAWEENIALQTEVEKRYATTESQIQIAKNALNEMGITISRELLPEIAELAQSFTEFVTDNKDDLVAFGKGVTDVFTFIVDNAEAAATGIGGVAAAITAAKLGLALSAGPVGIAIAGITALVGIYNHFSDKAKDAVKAQEAFRQELINSGDAFAELQAKTSQADNNLKIGDDVIKSYRELKTAINDSTLSAEEKTAKQEELAVAEQALIDLSDGLITKTDLESGAIEKLIPLLETQLQLKKESAQWEEDLFLKTHTKEMSEEEIAAIKDRMAVAQEEYDLISSAMPEITRATEQARRENENFGSVSDETWSKVSAAYAKAGIEIGDTAERMALLGYVSDEAKTWFAEVGAELYGLTVEAAQAESNLVKFNNAIDAPKIKALNDALKDGTITMGEYEAECAGMGISVDKAKASIEGLTKTVESNEKPVATVTGKYDALTSQLAHAKIATNLLGKASQTLTDGMLLEEHQLNELIEKLPELAKYVEETGDITFESGKKIIEIQNSIGVSSETMRLAAIKRAETELAAANTVIEGYEAERKALVKLMEAKRISAEILASESESQDRAYQKAVASAAEAQKALEKLKGMGPIAGAAFSSAGSSASKAMSEAEKSAEEARKKMEQEFNKMGDALTDAFKAQAQEQYDDNIELIDNTITAYKNLKDDKVKLAADTAEEESLLISNAEFDKLEIKRSYADKTYNMLSDAQREELALTEDKTDAVLIAMGREEEASKGKASIAIEGIDAQIDAQMELIRMTDQALYEDLMRIKERKDEINAEANARKELREAEAQAERIANLQSRIDNAETIEAQMKAEKELADYRQSLADKALEKAEKAELKQLGLDEKQLMKDAEKIVDAHSEVISGLKNERDTLVSETLEEYAKVSLEGAQKILEIAVQASPQAAAELLKQGEEGIKTAGEMLSKYAPQWQEKGKAFVDYFNDGMEESGETLIDGMTNIGHDAMEGMLQAIKDATPDMLTALKELANAILAAMQSPASFDINSPSKKTYAIGKYVGQGLIYGTVDTIKGMMPDIVSSAGMVTDAISTAGNHISTNNVQTFNSSSSIINNHYDTQMPIHFDNVDMRGQSDIVAVSESLAFLANQSLIGKGGR